MLRPVPIPCNRCDEQHNDSGPEEHVAGNVPGPQGASVFEIVEPAENKAASREEAAEQDPN